MPIDRPNVFSPAQSSTPNFFFDVARGAYNPFYRIVNLVGVASAVNSTEKPIAFQTGFEVYVSDPYIDVRSSSINDRPPTSLGAHEIYVEGVDTSGNLASEYVTLDGTTPVTLANEYQHINDSYVTKAGSSGTNSGTISFENSPSLEQLEIAPGVGRTQNGMYLVPLGHRMVMMSSTFTAAGSAADSEIEYKMKRYQNLFVNAPNVPVYDIYRGYTAIDQQHPTGPVITTELPVLFNPGDAILYTVNASGNPNADVAVQGYGVLMQDS